MPVKPPRAPQGPNRRGVDLSRTPPRKVPEMDILGPEVYEMFLVSHGRTCMNILPKARVCSWGWGGRQLLSGKKPPG